MKAVILILILWAMVVVAGSALLPGTVAGQTPDGPQSVTVILVIDDSGSMKDTDPTQLRRLGGRVLIERLFATDQIAVVIFSSQATVAQPLSLIGNDANREALKHSLDGLNSFGYTNMLDALDVAFNKVLDKDPSPGPKFVVFLTDGRPTKANGDPPTDEDRRAMDELLKSYRAKDWPIFPISFGVDVDKDFLGNVAKVSGGGECDAVTADKLVDCFQEVLDRFRETDKFIALRPGCVAEHSEHPVFIDPYTRRFTLVLALKAPTEAPTVEVEIEVYDPSGNPQGRSRKEGDFLFYNFEKPNTGTWLIKPEGIVCFKESFAFVDSDVRISLRSPQLVHPAGQPMKVQALIEGRTSKPSSSWEPRDGAASLTITDPQGKPTSFQLTSSGREHLGKYLDTTLDGDYRLRFEVTLAFSSPDSPAPIQRIFSRELRVEVVEAPFPVITHPAAGVQTVLPGDPIAIRGRIIQPHLAISPTVNVKFASKEFALSISPDGSFSGEATPAKEGLHTLEVSLQDPPIGRRGEVLYHATTSVDFTVEFAQITLELTEGRPPQQVRLGESVPIVVRAKADQAAISVDQSAIIVELTGPRQRTVKVDLRRGDGVSEFRGEFFPLQGGTHSLASLSTNITRNGVIIPYRISGTIKDIKVIMDCLLEHNLSTIVLGQVYPGAEVDRTFRVSTSCDQQISLAVRLQSEELAVSLNPTTVPPNARDFEVLAKFQIKPDAKLGNEAARTDLVLVTDPPANIKPGPIVPVTYQVQDFYVQLPAKEHNLGYIRREDTRTPIILDVLFKAPAAFKLEANIPDAPSVRVVQVAPSLLRPPPEGREGREKVNIWLEFPGETGPGTYRGSIFVSADPSLPIRPAPEVSFRYRIPSRSQVWVLDYGRWPLLIGGVVILTALALFARSIIGKPVIQGRVEFGRIGSSPGAPVDLGLLRKPTATIGSDRGCDLCLPDENYIVSPTHAQIRVVRGEVSPKLYPESSAPVLFGPTMQPVDATGVPLSTGDIFYIGQYKFEWIASAPSSSFARIWGDTWWRRGLALLLLVPVVAIVFYVVIL